MKNNPSVQDLGKVRELMKRMKLMKGQIAHIATSDSDGTPNLAPIGSMRITDDGKVHVIQGFLPKTFSNLKQNPKATFSVFKLPGLTGFFSFFRDKEDDNLGFRIYCDFIEVVSDEPSVQHETKEILKRFPWLLRKPFGSFAKENFKKVLVFKINELRETK